MVRPIVNYLGQRFGKLLVVDLLEKKYHDRYALWLCKCDCSKWRIVRSANIRDGMNQCGCVRPYNRKKPLKSYTEEDKWQREIESMIYSAKQRNIQFCLDVESVKSMMLSNCHYCDERPTIKTSGLYRNGIDRLNVDEGYTDSNVVPCCSTCNYAKGVSTEPEFLEHVSKIYKFRVEKCA